ncbi:hypothetical protein [Nonomuraea typhae]|uniref:hypothetical protein n=1 Tax=Nonomuraea typhae TaxID=2603600 RepID=UPI0012FCFB68|nr:hypothetical protein [Nonomuraea typhae]
MSTPLPAPAWGVLALTPTPPPPQTPGGGGVCDLPGADAICAGISGAVGSVAGSVINELAEAFQQAQIKALGMMATFWATTPTPTLSDSSGPVAWLQERTHWYVALLAVLGLLLAAGKLAIQRRAEPAAQAATGLLTLAVVTGCGTAVLSLLTEAGDAYSHWIIHQALDDADFSGAITRLASFQALTLTPGLMIILALLSILSCLLQIVLMLARIALLGLLAGALPLAAALATSASGRTWLVRVVVWGVAFDLYKPAASTIYAYAFVAMGTPNSALAQMSGLVMIALAVVALPALMRFLTPAVTAAGTGGGGGGAATVGAGVATGARALPMLGGRHGSGPPSGGGGPGHGPRGARTASPQPSGPGTGQASGTAPSAAASRRPTPTASGTAGTAGAAGKSAASASAAGAAAGPVIAAGQAAVKATGAARRRAARSTEPPGGPDGSR